MADDLYLQASLTEKFAFENKINNRSSLMTFLLCAGIVRGQSSEILYEVQ